MAKKNKNRYRKGGPARLDMRKGGRVSLQEGGAADTEELTRREKRKEERQERRQGRKTRRTARRDKRQLARQTKGQLKGLGYTRKQAREAKKDIKGQTTLEAAGQKAGDLIKEQEEELATTDTRRPLKQKRNPISSSGSGGTGGGFVPGYSTEGGASVTGPVGTAAAIESGQLIPSEAGQQLGGGIPASGVIPEPQAPVMPAQPTALEVKADEVDEVDEVGEVGEVDEVDEVDEIEEGTVDSETGNVWNGTEYVRPTSGIGAYASATWNGTEWGLTNPILTGSELGKWVAEQGEDGNRKLYNIHNDPNSGHLMDIWWVTYDGQVGFTDEGWSRVPKADRRRVFRTQEEAHGMIQSYDQYNADLVHLADNPGGISSGDGSEDTTSDPAEAAEKHKVPEERRDRIDRTATGIEKARAGIIVDKDGVEIDLKLDDAVNAGGYVLNNDGTVYIDPDTNEPVLVVADQDASKSKIPTYDEDGNRILPQVTAPDAQYVRNADGTVAKYPEGHDKAGEPIPTITEEDVSKVEDTAIESAKVTGYQRDSQGELVMDEDGNPIPITASTYDAAQVGTYVLDKEGNPMIDPATGQPILRGSVEAATIDTQSLTEDSNSIAKLSDTALTLTASVTGATTAQTEIDKGKVLETVTGTVSPDAKMDAITKVAGTTLPRVLRAKKQLRRAGLSEADINAFANDPEELEEKLLEYTEAERGMVAGLPDEALVNVQLNSLLDGMESGEIPTFARPAVAAVNQIMAERGLEASTVGRDNLFNAIIAAAMPIAQQNAQSIKESVIQQRGIEAQAEQLNAQMEQQRAVDNANKSFQMDMAEFTAEEQRVMSNSKFLQTVTLTDTSNKQQAALQQAVSQTQMDIAALSTREKLAVRNADAFLQMDLTNLNNEQQSNVLNSQMEQQRMLSNQAADNAARQFNSTSENQLNQFMENLAAQTDQFNVAQGNAMSQFNVTQENAAEARRTGREADLAKFNAQLVSQTDQFNSTQDFSRTQWNAQNAAAVEASNVQWRRQTNLSNTAAQNQINMQNAQNAFNLSTQSLAFLWQELRDQADFDFRAVENEENRKATIIATALANEGEAGQNYDDYLATLISSISTSYNQGLGGT